MAETLVAAGHRRLAYVANEPDAPERRLMRRGIKRAVRDAGLRQRDVAVVGGQTRPWRDSRRAGYELTAPLAGLGRATGLIYDSVGGVRGGLLALAEAGLAVPADASVVAESSGGGDEEFTVPPTTTVESRPEEEVRLAFQCILGGGSASCRTLAVPPAVRERRSVGPPGSVSRTGGEGERARASTRSRGA
jgi:LacI family transcriptional regulator